MHETWALGSMTDEDFEKMLGEAGEPVETQKPVDENEYYNAIAEQIALNKTLPTHGKRHCDSCADHEACKKAPIPQEWIDEAAAQGFTPDNIDVQASYREDPHCFGCKTRPGSPSLAPGETTIDKGTDCEGIYPKQYQDERLLVDLERPL